MCDVRCASGLERDKGFGTYKIRRDQARGAVESRAPMRILSYRVRRSLYTVILILFRSHDLFDLYTIIFKFRTKKWAPYKEPKV